MNDRDYTKREIDLHFSEMKHLLNDLKSEASEIKTQTLKTNGRVSRLEIWRGVTVGGIAVMVAIVLPILGYLALQIVSKAK